MGNGDKRPVASMLIQFLPQYLLDALVCLVIHARSRLVKQHELALADESSTQRENLALSMGEILAFGLYHGREADTRAIRIRTAVAIHVICVSLVTVELEGRDSTAVVESF